MKAQKCHYVCATAIVIEIRNNVLRNLKLDLTRHALCTVYHSTSSQVCVHRLLILKLLIQTSIVRQQASAYTLAGSLAFTRAPSTTRGQKAALLLQLFTDRMGGELDQLGYIRRRVGYRFAP